MKKRIVIPGIVVLAAMLALASPIEAAGSDQRIDPASCIAPWGVDLCTLLGVEVGPVPFDGCVLSGSPVSARFGWFVNQVGGSADFPLVYPAGYATDFPDDPLADFLSKLVSVKVVIDGGTREERTFLYSPSEHRAFATVGEFFDDPAAPDAAWPGVFITPTIHPLPVGQHGIQIFITLSAEHCDGLFDIPEEDCLAEGEVLVFGFPEGPPAGRPFHVVSRLDDPVCSG